MKKKTIWVLLAILLIIGTYFYVVDSMKTNNFSATNCPFCNQQKLDYQKFYEDDLVVALYTHRPIVPGHSLILPKRHVERFELLTDDEITRIGQVIKKVNKAAEKAFGTATYLLLQKNGQEVGQQVPHVHVHYIPRKAGDSWTIPFIFKMYISNLGSPISAQEMKKNVEKMKAAMNSQ